MAVFIPASATPNATTASRSARGRRRLGRLMMTNRRAENTSRRLSTVITPAASNSVAATAAPVHVDTQLATTINDGTARCTRDGSTGTGEGRGDVSVDGDAWPRRCVAG